MYDQFGKDVLSVFVANYSDWMVRIRIVTSLRNQVFSSIKGTGRVLHSKNSLGWSKYLPHSRCIPGDLLYPDGTLTLTIKVELLAENSVPRLALLSQYNVIIMITI